MSVEGTIEEDISRLAIASATDDAGITVTQEFHVQRPEQIRQTGDDDIAHDNSFVKAHAADDQTFTPVQRVPVEILAEIFVQCIPALPGVGNGDRTLCFGSWYGREAQEVRSCLGQVCLRWNIILNEEPRVWATLWLDNLLPTPEVISAWIKKSKSHPLDMYIDTRYYPNDHKDDIFKLIHKEIWRIRVLIGNFHWMTSDPWLVSTLIPMDVPTVAPMMQELTLIWDPTRIDNPLGSIHCPQLHTLNLCTGDHSVKFLVVKPMLNVQYLRVCCPISPVMWHFRLLEALPNLVSLTWMLVDTENDIACPSVPVVLQHLKSLTVRSHGTHSPILFLRSLNTPSLEYLEFRHSYHSTSDDNLKEALDILCGKGTIRLRHLTLRNAIPRGENIYPVLNHLMDLETLEIAFEDQPIDALLIALSPHNRDFSSVCPKLKVVDLYLVKVSVEALIEFVERRVQSDSEEPTPGLVTCLRLWAFAGIAVKPFLRVAVKHYSFIHFMDNKSVEWMFTEGPDLIPSSISHV